MSPIRFAYTKANEILRSRDGAGFRFIVTLNCGKTFDVITCADDNLVYPHEDIAFWEVEHGDNALILRHAEIAAIEVYEC